MKRKRDTGERHATSQCEPVMHTKKKKKKKKRERGKKRKNEEERERERLYTNLDFIVLSSAQVHRRTIKLYNNNT